MKFLSNIVMSALAVWITDYFVTGVHIDGIVTALIVAVVLGLMNATVGTVLRFIAFPFNVLTLGLVGSLIGFAMLLLTDSLIDGFYISNIRSGVIFALILGLITTILGIKKK